MSQSDTLIDIAQNYPSEQNLSTLEKNVIGDRVLQVQDLLFESNSDDVDYTGFRHRNGSTDAVGVDTSKILFSPPPQPIGYERFQAIQKWEGQVISVGEETFNAQLAPLIGEKDAQQEAELYIVDIDPSDHFLIKPGAIFYWSIGYLDGRPSGRIKASILRFRRLPAWDANELKRAKLKSSRLEDLLNVEQ
ncbi:hypothetical protein ACFLW2_04960 [Chloroflexota bacterium]